MLAASDLRPTSTSIVKEMRAIPVAGQDSMLLNLSGARAPFFTRNMIILQDTAANVGVGEVPGGEKILWTLISKDRRSSRALQ
jgi:glucarate dehydratase